MKSLFWSYTTEIETAFIIRIKGNSTSERLAARCMESCNDVLMPARYWDAYDGTGPEIIVPEVMKHNAFMRMLKVTDAYLVRAEVACCLSHISLWAKCVESDKPLVVYEHDALVIKPYLNHAVHGSIAYLGGSEQAIHGWPVKPTPPHASDGPGFHFICRGHAYSIDPTIAKNLLAHVLKMGICAPLDLMMRTDLFSIHQTGLFAYDVPDKTTISGRPQHGRTTERNDRLIN